MTADSLSGSDLDHERGTELKEGSVLIGGRIPSGFLCADRLEDIDPFAATNTVSAASAPHTRRLGGRQSLR